jgi:4-hydroxy-3-methylbut-2-en-1-yl diphosphate synthase IspG/GcpE
MVESALEFVRICESHDYHDLILSMKASNPVVVLQVYRLLARRLSECGMDYPFHLGVTEAGEGEDGRVKSAIGIGALLADGIGDTIRVSLTEDPVQEIPVARALAERYDRLLQREPTEPERPLPELHAPVGEGRDPMRNERRGSRVVRVGPHLFGGKEPVRVEVAMLTALTDEDGLRRELDGQAGPRVPAETRAELVSVTPRSDTEIDALERLGQSMELVAPAVALSAQVPLEWIVSGAGAVNEPPA